jgi:hypothetical protein
MITDSSNERDSNTRVQVSVVRDIGRWQIASLTDLFTSIQVLRHNRNPCNLSLQRPLLFGVFDDLLLDEHSFSFSYAIGIGLRDVGLVSLFSKVFQFFLGRRYPEWVLVEHLESSNSGVLASA